MKRLIGLALLVTMNASGGMGLSMSRWRQFRADASFLGVFRDFRGPRAAFFVEDQTGILIGRLDLDLPSGPGWPQTPGAEPNDLKIGDHVSVVYAGEVRAEHGIGLPPVEDLSKSRIDRVKANGPLEGVFVSAEK